MAGDPRDWIRAQAREAGFDAVGFVRPAKLEAADPAMDQWLQEGRHGSMKYLEDYRQRRQRFYREFPALRSVIVLGTNYFSSQESARPPEGLSGKVARYARGQDYHRLIRERHELLIARMAEKFGPAFQARSCVDTQPVPERHAAEQAGLGFVGKNTLLLSRNFGPWLFLSEIMTDLDLAEDEPAEGTCGTCSRCQTACPTGALDEDYRMDARRCIAYLTIEHKGAIPREMRPHLRDWVFGCDDCLTSCPFTSGQKETSWPELRPEAGAGAWLDFDRLFRLRSNREYEEAFRGTALLRAGRKQMLRNACVVLGNTRSERALPYLSLALQDASPLVRQHAAWALGEIPGVQARALLNHQLEHESVPEVLVEIREALATPF